MGRSPFIPNTDRGPKDDQVHPTIKGVGLIQSGISQTAKKGAHATLSSNPMKGNRNTQNPFTGRDQRPDSMISGGRGGSPDNSMMYQNKYNTASERP
jgi:hypothetical protein